MQVWLHPVDHVPDYSDPMPAVLTRINKACQDAGYNCEELEHVLHDACMVMPGNLDACRGNMDINEYASEVVHTERVRVRFPNRLKEALLDIDVAAGDTIEWCLPFIDYDLYFANHDRFIAGLRKFPKLTCYLVVTDPTNPLMSNYRGSNYVKMITDSTLELLAPDLGFPNKLQPPLPPPPPPAILPPIQPTSFFSDLNDPEEEPVKPKPKPKKQKQYPSIDD